MQTIGILMLVVPIGGLIAAFVFYLYKQEGWKTAAIFCLLGAAVLMWAWIGVDLAMGEETGLVDEDALITYQEGSITFNSGYVTWEPKEDITAYELAKCMNILLLGPNTSHGWYNAISWVKELPPNLQRHFRIHED